jgi:hypothetical protein
LVNCEERKRHVDNALDMIDGMHLFCQYLSDEIISWITLWRLV